MVTKEEAIAVFERFEKMKPTHSASKLEQMNRGMVFIIRYIYDHENRVSSGEIAKIMQVSTARIAAIANKLEEKELLVRIPDEEDLRKTYFSLTNKGIEICKMYMESCIEMLQYVLSNLEVGEMDEFLRIYEKLKVLGAQYVKDHPVPNIMEADYAKNV